MLFSLTAMLYNKQLYALPQPLKTVGGQCNLASPQLISILRDLLNRGMAVRIQVTGASIWPFLLGCETVTLHSVHASNSPTKERGQ